ncbi:nitrite reductase (NO-forming) [Aquimarina sp. MAR_2010_214]|uniref:c-type cytochrome n=1 Tax=Aquimarina sp. MAR_2010_214 TaxID=1250026 RepID=UPI000C711A1F|nr:cytochrome c [Aquimarina sp. MAR_2010_214]PKV49087.1 nitrite reductase (NO-forming) [Aquimarina sp. MAR_2010_214]
MKQPLITSFCFLAMFSCQPKAEKESIANGKEVYITNCISCHQPDGQGIEGIYPSLLKSDDITRSQTERTVTLIQFGSGFEGGMKPIMLTDKEITDVINYIQNTWQNKAPFLTKTELKQF